MLGGVWKRQRRPRAPAPRYASFPGRREKLGWPPSRMHPLGPSRSLGLALWPPPLRGGSLKCPSLRLWAHVLLGDPARTM